MTAASTIVLDHRSGTFFASIDDGREREVRDLASFVADRERERPRWVWDDTSWWYPRLLAEGVRVERCFDLRLCRTILRRSLLTAESELARAPLDGWDNARAPEVPPSGALFEFEAAPREPDDPVAEFRRQRTAVAGSAEPPRVDLLLAAESVGALIASELNHAGLPWDVERHGELLTEVLGARPSPGQRPLHMQRTLDRLRAALDGAEVNPDSPVELLRVLRRAGLDVSSTSKWELAEHDHPAIEPLLEYKRLARLLSANGWNWLETWVRDGRFRADFVPGGVVTGRWATSGGGALQLPKQIRGAVIADPGWVFVVADASQLEPRILAALSGDRSMIAAAGETDMYNAIVASGAVDTREHAKIGMLGAMYGGTTGQSGRLLPRLARAYPRAIGFVEDAARTGERGGQVMTRLGRTSPLPDTAWFQSQRDASSEGATPAGVAAARTRARAFGRFTRNFVVQGTAAEWALCWLAGIRQRLSALAGHGWFTTSAHLVFFVHDEVVVHCPIEHAPDVERELREAASAAGRLLFGDAGPSFPVTVATVRSYADAK
ncbi:DNA polymerase-1 [Microbacteriaceae bacterium SG_E_30_P1]|uniref:DNA-directed DNA polymerase n=1 Tax=Antiquaquibacter oligotrophicus TaxID=2880260 RepID=A0ABT6KM60_9MICO|nr:bifunctional 3'-5' exonuclease/DNA polymerase [Antiquaquibacter oligotrophicus]MDH6181101.1 DNA polymerase-1 [Antiquaquibacter oligotrophicus]UDF13201.1 bifunctional 3'-5' exonuclease/DNA polymerase [Antiquaquibacter oligotrophicus]